MRTLLISTYDLGRQPFGLASPAAWLRAAGVEVTCVDLAKERLPAEAVASADLAAFHLPMHTATRLALPVIEEVRRRNPGAQICCYGLYAPLNEGLLRARGVQHVLGAEFEAALTALATGHARAEDAAEPAAGRAPEDGPPPLPRLAFRVPDRRGLPPLTRYASVQVGRERRVAGATEASRGCKHLCRHCPIVPVYGGRFRVIPPDVVLADVRAQVEAGARHITFGDPDFFNGIRHALTVVEALARECPGVTYDVTIKIEHLLRHAAHLRTLRETGCLFVTSAVESVDDRVLALLDKGHTRADFERAVALCRAADLALSPTFVAFTPWIDPAGYCDLLGAIASLDLVDHVAPIQLAIRLLIPEGSRLLELPDIRHLVGPFEPATLTYPWAHPDPRVDALQAEVSALVGAAPGAPRRQVFDAVAALASARAGLPPIASPSPPRPRTEVPYLNEPWYC